MKKLIIIVISTLLILSFTGCDTTFEVQKNDSVIITIECDEDDVDDYGQWYNFDEGDLESKSDLEDILEDLEDEIEDETDGDFTIKIEFKPEDDEDSFDNGFAIGSANKIF